MTEPSPVAISPLKTALTHCCPRCGQGKIYRGLLTITPQCAVCELPLGAHDVGDGPAYCAIVLLGFAVTGAASWLEIMHTPPMWVHAAVTLGLMLVLTIPCLRFFKSYILATQHQSGELTDGPEGDI